ncbi:glycosyltransferase [Arthrobacter sp. MDT2-2]
MSDQPRVRTARAHAAPAVVFVSHTADAGVFKVGSHHLAREVAGFGYRVLHLSTPWSLMHQVTKAGNGSRHRSELALTGPRMDAAGVLHASLRTLLPAQLMTSGASAKLVDSLGFSECRYMFVDQPLMAGSQLFDRASTVIYRPTDLYPGGHAGRRQDWAVRHAHGVAATSQVVLSALPSVQRQLRTVVENGVEYSRFRYGDDAPSARDGVAYVGALDHRFDWQTVNLLAQCFPDTRFDIAGPIPSQIPSLPTNVRLMGSLPYEAVPAFLAGHKVGLLPLSPAVENSGRSPMKLYEYLASGLYVLATRQGDGKSNRGDGVGRFSSPDEGRTLLGGFLSEEGPNDAGAAVAASEDWAHKARILLDFAAEVAAAHNE